MSDQTTTTVRLSATLPMISEARTLWINAAAPKVWARDRVSHVAAQYALQPQEIMQKTSARRIAYARQHAMSELRDMGWSLARIGRFFNIHHTTVWYGLRRYAERAAKISGVDTKCS